MDNYQALDAIDAKTGLINAVIDTPKGSNGKYKHDQDTGLFHLSKLLPLGAYFPYNFGFIPQTRGEDGDELDILVIMDDPLHIGAVVPVRVVGMVLEMGADGLDAGVGVLGEINPVGGGHGVGPGKRGVA